MRPAPRSLALAVALLAAGCGSSPPSVTLTLDPASPPPAAVQAAYRGPPVAVPAVHVPAAIDRVEFVAQPAAGTLRIDDFARWAAPLGILARDALVRDLGARLPAGSVLPPGAAGAGGRATTIDVTILSFRHDAGGAALEAAWRRLPGGPVRQAALSDTGGAKTPATAADAFSRLIGQLADRIAADVAGRPG